MRLTEQQKKVICDSVAEVFGGKCKARLFGSRLDDQAKGGDIDLLMECCEPVDNAGLAAARLAARIQMRIGERKIDVLYAWPGMTLSPAHRAALEQGKEL